MRAVRFQILVLVAASGASARAAVESPEVKAGVAAYERLECEAAIDILQKAVAQSLTREEYSVAYQTLAFCHVAVGRDDLAILDFEGVLRSDESFDLDRTKSPRERAAFEEARRRFATGHADVNRKLRALSALKPEISPVRPHAGDRVRVRVHYPGGLAERLSMFYRTRGAGLYDNLQAESDGEGQFELTVPGSRVQPPGLEYYLVALDQTGASMARAGSLPRPLYIDVAELRKPIYKRGWFWGVIGGVAVAGITVATAVTLSRSGPGPNTPSTVTIMLY
jgi:hypothetical protein